MDSRLAYIDSLDFVPDAGPYEANSNWNRQYQFYPEIFPGEEEETYTFDLYVNNVDENRSGAWKDVRLRMDEPSATDTTVHFHVLRQDGTSYVDALTVAAGNQTPRYSTIGGTSGVLQLRPALVLMQGSTLAAGNPEIVVDSTHLGQMGDMVPSTKGSTGERHFVTPKKNDSTPLLDLDHVLLRCQMSGSSTPMTSAQFDADYEWVIPSGKGTVDPSDKGKCKIYRTAAEKIVVQVRKKNSGPVVATLNVWVVWAEIAVPPAVLSSWPESTRTIGGVTYCTPKFSSVTFTYDIKPLILFTGYNAGHDVPNLSGSDHSLPEMLPEPATSINEDTAVTKWDVTRRLRVKIKNTVTSPSIVASQLAAGRGMGLALTAHASSFPASSVEIMTFPTDPWRGNDDPQSMLGEDGNPYSDTDSYVNTSVESTDPKPSIGQIASYDRPTSPGIAQSAGANGETVEAWLQFEEFARLELGSVSNAKWYVISAPEKWESIKKFKKDGIIFIWMVDDGSVLNLGHSPGY